MKKTIILIFMVLCAGFMRAQVVDSAQLLIKYVPKLANSNKINQQAVLRDTVVSEQVEFNYVVAPAKPELSFAPGEMQVGKLNPEVKERYYRNYLKLGFGYPVTPLAELSMHNCQNPKYSYGLNFHHFSSWAGPIGKEQKKFAYAPTSDTRVHLFFNRIFKNHTLYSSVGYNHELANLYGYSTDWVCPELYLNPEQYYAKEYRDSIRNNFNHVRAELGFRSNFTADEKRLKEDVRVNYDFVRTSWKNMEHGVGLHGMLAYDAKFLKISGYQHYQLDFGFDYFNNTWSDSVPMGTDGSLLRRRAENSLMFELKPSMRFSIREYHLMLGVGIPVLNQYNKTQCPVYPMAELQMGLIREVLNLYVGVDGRSEYTSLKNLLYENPYVKPNIDTLKFSKCQISIYGGVKGKITDKLNYHVSARYSYRRDLPFFMLDTASLLKNQFDVVYAKKGTELDVNANLSWEAINHLYLTLNGRYHDFYFLEGYDWLGSDGITGGKPLYNPRWEIGFEGKYIWRNRFIFTANAKVGFDRWAVVPYAQPVFIYNEFGEPVPVYDDNGNQKMQMAYSVENDIHPVYKGGKSSVKPVLNFGVGFEYLITKQFTAFAQINNIGHQYATNYYGFNNFGINAIVGITYSFGNEAIKPLKKKSIALKAQ
ncbi:MAG: hypothetical protein IKN78_03050 [Bacteroidales bacterium]|nr:hypothetical protein [Bacteroidales bacterium]